MFPKYIDDKEALRIGIQFEIDAYNEFKTAFKKHKNDDIKSLLSILANNVFKNRKRLEERYLKLSGKKLLYLNLNKTNFIVTSFLSQQSDLEVIENTIQRKQNKLNFLEYAALQTNNICGKKMFYQLASEERVQVDLLRLEYKVRVKLNENGKHCQIDAVNLMDS